MIRRTLNREELHKTFGGIIWESDFCTDFNKKSGNCVERIITSWRFDKRCCKNIKNRNQKNNQLKENQQDTRGQL